MPSKITARKGEIARNEQFLLFPRCFLPVFRTSCHLHQIKKLSSANSFSFEESEICRSGKSYADWYVQPTYCDRTGRNQILSHNNPCFQCNIAITNFLVSNTCEIRFHDVKGQSTVPMYSYAKILKT